MKTLYERGSERLEKEMDIIWIIKNIRTVKQKMNSVIKERRIEEKIEFDNKNVIVLDETDEDLGAEKK